MTAGQAAQFTLAVDQPSMTLVTSQHTTIHLSLGSVKSFTDTVNLGCLGLPLAATCTFTNSQLKLPANGIATTTLIVDTGDPLGAGTGASRAALRGNNSTLLCMIPAGLLLAFRRRRRAMAVHTRLGGLLLLIAALTLTIGAAGCSGLSTTSTPPGSYTFKVVGTGQGSGITQAETITLVVTQ